MILHRDRQNIREKKRKDALCVCVRARVSMNERERERKRERTETKTDLIIKLLNAYCSNQFTCNLLFIVYEVITL